MSGSEYVYVGKTMGRAHVVRPGESYTLCGRWWMDGRHRVLTPAAADEAGVCKRCTRSLRKQRSTER